MRDSLLLAGALLIGMVGFAWLALAMDVHWRQVRTDVAMRHPAKRELRILGGLAIAASLGLCLAVDHPTMAALAWFMMLAASALAVTFTLTWRPSWLSFLVAWIRSAER